MSKIVNYSSALTTNVSSYSGYTGNITIANQNNGINSSASTNTNTYATITPSSNSSSGYAIYGFDTSEIPSNATITSVECVARARTGSNNTVRGSFQLFATNTAKGSPTFYTSRTASNYRLTTGTWNGSEIQDVRLRVGAQRTGNNTGNTRFYGATITVNYSVNSTEYEVNVINNSEATVSPTYFSGSGEDCVITFTGIESSNDIIVTDNNVDVTDQLTYITPSPNGSDSTVLGEYNLISGGFNSGESYFEGLVGKGENNSTTTSNYYSNGSSTIAVFTYDLVFDNIPSNATITRLYARVNGHAESTSQSSEYMCAQLILNTTGNTISDELNFKSIGTSNSTQTIEATTLPTVSQLSGLKLMCRLGYYGGAINGATCYVEYTTPSDPYYAYTISNISADHVISIDDAAGGTYYEVNASSTYTGATTSPSTQSIREGRSATVNIGVANLYEIIVKDNGADVTSSVTGASGSYTYTVSNVQAAHTITVEENTNYSVTVASTYTGATGVATPSKVYIGQSSVVEIDVDNLYEIVVKDNGVDITSSIVQTQSESTSVGFVPVEFVSSASSYSSVYNSYNPENGLTNSGSTTRACVYSNTGSGVESKLVYKFDCSSIPSNATITSVICGVKCSVYQTSYFATRTIQLYHGDTAKGTATTITATGSNGTGITTDGGTWTREELNDISIVERVVRGTSNTSSDASFSFWGANLVISYTTPDSCTYTLTNVQGNHVITIEEAANYSITTTNTYAGATVSANPTKVYNGRSSTITVFVQNLYEINITDNGNDIKSSLVGSNGTYTYTLTNVQTAHTISVTEATYYSLVASSSHDTATISPTTMKVYHGQNAVFTINGDVSDLILKDNGVDVSSSISNGSYTITNVTAVHTLTVLNKPADFVKIDGSYKKVGKVFKKIDGVWVEINKTAFDDFVSTNIMMYGGNISISEIGNVETNGEVVNININNNALSTGTYKLIYEDEHREPLDNVDKITEFTI